MRSTIQLNGRVHDCATEIIRRLQISPTTFYNWKRKGVFPDSIKLANSRFYDRELYEKMLMNQQHRSAMQIASEQK